MCQISNHAQQLDLPTPWPALIEMRRDLMWNRQNAPRVAQVLKAITNEPEGFIRNEKARWAKVVKDSGAKFD